MAAAAKKSAGILLYRNTPQHGFEVLIVHPGGPFWAKRDAGSWSVPKGEFTEGEQPLDAAKREFAEEVGSPAPEGAYLDLGSSKQPSGKTVYVFALKSDFNLEQFKSNMFTMEWPPKSGAKQEFPECDKAAWFPLAAAKQKLVKGQAGFIDALADALHIAIADPPASQTGQTSLF